MRQFHRFGMDSERALEYMEDLRAAYFGESNMASELDSSPYMQGLLEGIAQVYARTPDIEVRPLDIDITIEWDALSQDYAA